MASCSGVMEAPPAFCTEDSCPLPASRTTVIWVGMRSSSVRERSQRNLSECRPMVRGTGKRGSSRGRKGLSGGEGGGDRDVQ